MVSLCTPDAFAVSAGAWSMDKSVHVLYLCSRVFCVCKYTAFCIAGRGDTPTGRLLCRSCRSYAYDLSLGREHSGSCPATAVGSDVRGSDREMLRYVGACIVGVILAGFIFLPSVGPTLGCPVACIVGVVLGVMYENNRRKIERGEMVVVPQRYDLLDPDATLDEIDDDVLMNTEDPLEVIDLAGDVDDEWFQEWLDEFDIPPELFEGRDSLDFDAVLDGTDDSDQTNPDDLLDSIGLAGDVDDTWS